MGKLFLNKILKVSVLSVFLLISTFSFCAPKLVTIDGAVTEIVVALGAQDEIVGRDSTSLFPQSITTLPDVGYLRALSVEGVLSLKPDVIVTTSDAGPPETLTMLKKMGVNIHVVDNQYSVEGVLLKIEQVANIIGRQSQGVTLINVIKKNISELNVPKQNTSIMLVMGGGDRGFMVGGKHTRADAMIQLAGGFNIMSEIDGYKLITPEAMLAKNPDVILLLRSALSAEQFSTNASIKNTNAAKQNKVFDVTGLNLLTFGPRIDVAIKTLVELIN
ncbi:MAG: ABC transporter substrate-binding protein [Saccharospirillaceae bacterium]|nr:ABC transporter substrate-binding protein [Pseudomonadales bacterium]NRB80268.1 ABC transporter substrate-binding protein [Saccharospirillaceae bacterium]